MVPKKPVEKSREKTKDIKISTVLCRTVEIASVYIIMSKLPEQDLGGKNTLVLFLSLAVTVGSAGPDPDAPLRLSV